MATPQAAASPAAMSLMQPLSALGLVAASAVLTACLIIVIKPLLVRFLLARPNARSSHKVATPQGAGIAVMLVLLAVCGVGATLLLPAQQGQSLWPVLAGAAALTVLGTLDDAHALAVTWRLIGQTVAALAIVATLPPDLRLLPDILPLLAERALLVLGTVACINAVNFLDGIDWMTVAEIVPITLAVALLAALHAVPPGVGLLALVLLGTMLGFAAFNKHPAQMFLGDAGSLPIGLCLAFLLIFVARADLAAGLLLALYIAADTGVTLCRRLINKEPVFSAHRSHFYQRAVSHGFSVPQVTARVFLLGVLLGGLAIGAVLAHSGVVDLLLLAIGAAATGLALRSLGRGRQ
jgi:UDP-N-acetylmuramyl pentapeptide phosphotransferase/UDP-N-acetylglucosamine-1-phosphate transferase